MQEDALREVFYKTRGHCHFCGDKLDLNRRGWSEDWNDRHWEVDHVIQRGRGGSRTAENCLPACTPCNRLRWYRTGRELRRLLLLGLVAAKEIKKNSAVGQRLVKLCELHEEEVNKRWKRAQEKKKRPERAR